MTQVMLHFDARMANHSGLDRAASMKEIILVHYLDVGTGHIWKVVVGNALQLNIFIYK